MLLTRNKTCHLFSQAPVSGPVGNPSVMSALVRRSDGDGNSCPSELLDVPRNSRLFVVLGKDVGPSEIREHFGPFGDIQDVCMVRDKRTNLPKGVAFVKYARSSQACLAMEKMHGTFLAPNTRPIKVCVCVSASLGGSGAFWRAVRRDKRSIYLLDLCAAFFRAEA